MLRNVADKIKEECCGCGLCEQICPQKAISFEYDSEGFLYPKVNSEQCVNCGLCIKQCSFVSPNAKVLEPDYYIARLKNESELLKSASGGLFAALSDYVLELGGRVYGATYDSDWKVVHIGGDNVETRDLMRDSKYVQSDIRTIYQDCLETLKTGRFVLFTGTPCQTSALRRFIEKTSINTDKLILCDLVCHGVGSPQIWSLYLTRLQRRIGRIVNIKTRNKSYGSGYNMTITGEKENYRRPGSADPYVSLFQQNCILRPSCFHCPMKNINRVGDLTIGDFQKAKQYYPQYYDGKGVSVALVNTEKGKKLLQKIQNRLNFQQVSKESAMQINLQGQIGGYVQRNVFFKRLNSDSFETVLKKYTEVGLKNKCIGKTKRFIKSTLALLKLRK